MCRAVYYGQLAALAKERQELFEPIPFVERVARHRQLIAVFAGEHDFDAAGHHVALDSDEKIRFRRVVRRRHREKGAACQAAGFHRRIIYDMRRRLRRFS